MQYLSLVNTCCLMISGNAHLHFYIVIHNWYTTLHYDYFQMQNQCKILNVIEIDIVIIIFIIIWTSFCWRNQIGPCKFSRGWQIKRCSSWRFSKGVCAWWNQRPGSMWYFFMKFQNLLAVVTPLLFESNYC